VRRVPGWIVLSGIALQIVALAAADRLLRRRVAPPEVSKRGNGAMPAFINEVADGGARRYHVRIASHDLYAGFYSDGRVRLATSSGRRFSGVMVAKKAVMADLGADDSFEMDVVDDAGGCPVVEMNGGPFDGHRLAFEILDL